MTAPQRPPKIKGRSIGIVVLTAVQILIGVIHIVFGLLLLAYTAPNFVKMTFAYDVYTVAFGVFTAVFAALIWHGKVAGWIGTVAVLLFVVVADSLTLLGIPSIPGIPKLAGVAEIPWGVLILVYLLATWKRRAVLAGYS
jgi:hypothetical protein